MSSLFGILGVGARGMATSTFGVQLHSHNTSNAATPGFTRRAAVLESIPGSAEPPQAGGGTRVRDAHRIIDRFLERRVLDARSGEAFANARSEGVRALDEAFALDDAGIGAAMNEFGASLLNLSARPDDSAVRRGVLGTAERLASAIRDASQVISTRRSDLDRRVTDGVATANGLIAEISDLNRRIVQAEIDGFQASDLRDSRDTRIAELSDWLPIEVVEQPDGQAVVTLNAGETLVGPDGNSSRLETIVRADGTVAVGKRSAGALVDVSAQLQSGRLGGQIAVRDGVLLSALTDLDTFATEFANAYNAIHAGGDGLDGGTGRALFDLPAAGRASAGIRLSTDVAGLPERIAAASSGGPRPGDNRNALALVDVSRSLAFRAGTMTADDALSNMTATYGQEVASANTLQELASGTRSNVDELRASVSGVSTDDEMVQLMQYQRAYEAALRVVQTADEMLQALINMR